MPNSENLMKHGSLEYYKDIPGIRALMTSSTSLI